MGGDEITKFLLSWSKLIADYKHLKKISNLERKIKKNQEISRKIKSGRIPYVLWQKWQ